MVGGGLRCFQTKFLKILTRLSEYSNKNKSKYTIILKLSKNEAHNPNEIEPISTKNKMKNPIISTNSIG